MKIAKKLILETKAKTAAMELLLLYEDSKLLKFSCSYYFNCGSKRYLGYPMLNSLDFEDVRKIFIQKGKEFFNPGNKFDEKCQQKANQEMYELLNGLIPLQFKEIKMEFCSNCGQIIEPQQLNDNKLCTYCQYYKDKEIINF